MKKPKNAGLWITLWTMWITYPQFHRMISMHGMHIYTRMGGLEDDRIVQEWRAMLLQIAQKRVSPADFCTNAGKNDTIKKEPCFVSKPNRRTFL